MEFWGVEVKGGKPLKVVPEDEYLIHISQVSIGEAKGKGSENVALYVKVGDQKLLVATLSHEKFPQVSLDLVFEKEFELSHNLKNGSVFLLGYKTTIEDEEDASMFSDFESDEEDDIPLDATENETGVVAAAKPTKPVKEKKVVEASKSKNVAPVVVASEEDDDSDDSEFDEDDDDDEDDEDEDEDSDDVDEMVEDDSSEEEEEETPKKEAIRGKKKHDSSSKKAKVGSPIKSEGKKNQTSTPHPTKKGAKPQNPKGKHAK